MRVDIYVGRYVMGPSILAAVGGGVSLFGFVISLVVFAQGDGWSVAVGRVYY